MPAGLRFLVPGFQEHVFSETGLRVGLDVLQVIFLSTPCRGRRLESGARHWHAAQLTRGYWQLYEVV